jgi:hypothetical protein
VEQEVPVVALTMAEVGERQAVGIGLPEVARIDPIPGHAGAPFLPEILLTSRER